MARDYEDFSSIDDLDDDELRQLVRDRLGEHPNIDLDDIAVHVDNGTALTRTIVWDNPIASLKQSPKFRVPGPRPRAAR